MLSVKMIFVRRMRLSIVTGLLSIGSLIALIGSIVWKPEDRFGLVGMLAWLTAALLFGLTSYESRHLARESHQLSTGWRGPSLRRLLFGGVRRWEREEESESRS